METACPIAFEKQCDEAEKCASFKTNGTCAQNGCKWCDNNICVTMDTGCPVPSGSQSGAVDYCVNFTTNEVCVQNGCKWCISNNCVNMEMGCLISSGSQPNDAVCRNVFLSFISALFLCFFLL